MEINKEFASRYLLVGILITLFGLAIVVRIISVQFFSDEGRGLREKAQQNNIKKIEPARGIIYSHDGKELAIAVPIYRVALDYRAIEKDTTFENNKRALADSLSHMFGKSKSYYLQLLEKAKRNNRMVYLHNTPNRFIDYEQCNRIKQFPILKYGKYKGGLTIDEYFKRDYPYGDIARRTIGNFKIQGGEGVSEYGLELYFEKDLAGTAVEIDTSLKTEKQIRAIDGYDIITNLDVGIQSAVHEELLKSLRRLKAEWGCAIVMETKTGAILAISNLSINPRKIADSIYTEYISNFAVEERRDPGSTIKLPSLMIALADEHVTPDDSITLRTNSDGVIVYKYQYVATQVRDWNKEYANKKVTVRDIFAHSSNMGVSKIIYDNYVSHNRSEDFYKRLQLMGLDKKTGIDLPKEAAPDIKDFSKWDGGTLIQMSYGYELGLTPLQILTFYNAVANDGKMMKPYLVQQIKNGSEVVKQFKPTVLNPAVCNQKTLELAKELLLSVIESPAGTAKNIKNNNYRIAGKTGSAQTYNEATGRFDKVLRGSFCGYFPADNPKYTCMVVIQGAKDGFEVGGGGVSKVFKSIADRIYFSDHELRNQMNADEGKDVKIPLAYNGYEGDFNTIFRLLELPQVRIHSDWVQTSVQENTMHYSSLNIVDDREKITPNLKGMGMRDAVYLAENAGLKVICTGSGYGRVVSQSIAAGTPTQNYSQITLEFR
ncbi:MAG: transpeptidase family protein [Bacteroidales bacterium]|jgi:cell division protein FtsI (penicillin-binding protein 3)|nr:transpeptidase family protein [Bacteroidales bacterium]